LLDLEKKNFSFRMGMRMETVRLKRVDCLEIVCLMDNCVDFTSSMERWGVQNVRMWVARCMGEKWVKQCFRLPIAEHGLSC